MIYYIYYGYIAGVTVYKAYEYWEIAKVVYTTCNYTYIAVNGVYKWVKYPVNLVKEDLEDLEDLTSLCDEWDMCDVCDVLLNSSL
jgi:hypothetical protein